MGRRLLCVLLATVLGLSGVAAAEARDPGFLVTVSLSKSPAVTGDRVTVTGTLTHDGQPVSGARLGFNSYDAQTGRHRQDVVTDDEGRGSVTLRVGGRVDGRISSDNAPTVEFVIRVHAKVTIRPVAEVAGPLRTAAVRASIQPSGLARDLVVQIYGGGKWHNAPDGRAVWGTKPGTLKIRAVLPDNYAFITTVSATRTVTVGRAAVPAWLVKLNRYRTLNNAAPVAVDPTLSAADALHVRYMYKTGDYAHNENSQSKWHTKAGAQAGRSSVLSAGDPDPLTGWIQAPLHATSELDRGATVAGFATGYGYAALWLDDRTSHRSSSSAQYQFPANGRTTALRANNAATETPDPRAGCSRAQRAAGVNGLGLLFGNNRTPRKITASLTTGRTKLQVCVTSWYGTTIVLPLKVLQHKHTYTVRVAYAGKLQSQWRFHVR